MPSDHTKTKKTLLAELEDARRKTAELEAELTRCESTEQFLAHKAGLSTTLFQESEEKFRALVEMTSDFIWEVNASLDFTYVSAKVKDILGYDPSEILGKPIFFLMQPEEVTRIGQDARDIVQNKQPFRDLQYVGLDKEGRRRILEASGAPMLNSDGKLTGYRGATRDITERKKIEDDLRESHHLLETIGSSLQAYLFVKDNEGRYTYVNPLYLKTSGLTRQQVIGHTDVELFPPEHAETIQANDQRIMDSGRSETIEETVTAPTDGLVYHFISNKVPLRNEAGEVTGILGISIDITDRRKMEHALRESEERFRTILESIHIGIVIIDAETHIITDLNPYAAQLVGLPKEKIVGRGCQKFICPTDCENCPITDQKRQVDNAEGELLVADGRSLTILKTVVPIRIEGREHLLESLIDITERKRTEDTLRKLNRAVEQTSAAIIVTDNEAQIEFVNPAFTRLTGFTIREVLGKKTSLLKSGFHPPKFFREMWDTLIKGDTWSREILNKKKNDELFWQYVSIAPVKDEHGNTTHYVSVQEDITDLKRSQGLLQEALTEFEALFENSSAGIIQLKGGRYVHRINNRFTEILGYASEDVVGQGTRMLHLSEESYDAFGEKYYPDLIAGKTVHVEQEVQHKDGSTVWCDVYGKALFPPNLEKGVIIMVVDISTRKELESLREDMERIMRHDMKTPLNGIIGLPQILMADDNLTQNQREGLELIQETGQRMLDQIDLSLDLFKMETGAYGFTPTTVDLTLILHKLEKDLEFQAKEKNVELEIPGYGTSASQPLPGKALGDELLCYSMLANILKNAVEASPPPESVSRSASKNAVAKWTSR
jgi:PAS domain S-box-containing protein